MDSNLNVVTMSRVTTTAITFSMSSHRHRHPRCTSYVSLGRRPTVHSVILLVMCAILLSPSASATDPVYVRSINSFGQLVTSSTLRWIKGQGKDAVTLIKPNQESSVICRVWHSGLRGIGLVSQDGDVCNINTQEGAEGSDKFQTISGSASRLIWSVWKRPNPPPTGAVAIDVKPQKFIAADLNSTMMGVLDPTVNLGSATFSNQPKPVDSCLILTEIEPIRYELSDVQLKRNKGFIEEDIVLAYGKLQLPRSELSTGDSEESNDIEEIKRGRVEKVLSYETDHYDYWGQGGLMAKGLHTSINLPDGSSKVIEWGIPLTQAGKTDTMEVEADLVLDTGINMTLKGTRLNGEMSYWASLKTIFKDGSTSTRLIDGHRKIIEVTNIRLEKSHPYFLTNGTFVPLPTTSTTTTTTSTALPPVMPDEYEEDKYSEEETASKALPVESGIQADQSQNLVAAASPAAKSFALSQATTSGWSGLLLCHSVWAFNILATLRFSFSL